MQSIVAAITAAIVRRHLILLPLGCHIPTRRCDQRSEHSVETLGGARTELAGLLPFGTCPLPPIERRMRGTAHPTARYQRRGDRSSVMNNVVSAVFDNREEARRAVS